MSTPIAIRINEKQQLDNWRSYAIESDLLQPADAFSVTLNNPAGFMVGKIAKYDLVEVLVDGAVQMTGYVDDLNWSVDGGGAKVEVTGRDLFGLLVDCSIAPKTYRSKDLLQLAKAIAGQWVGNWEVHNEANRLALQKASARVKSLNSRRREWLDDDTGPSPAGVPIARYNRLNKLIKIAKANQTKMRATVYPRIKVDPGQTAFDVLKKVAKAAELMLWLAADGTGIISRPNYAGPVQYTIDFHNAESALRDRNNVLSARCRDSGGSRYQTYTYAGSTLNTVDWWGNQTLQKHEITDPEVTIPRTIWAVGSAKSRTEAKRNAERQQQRAEFESLSLDYTVRGHKQGDLTWQVDSLVNVDDEINGFQDVYYLTKRRFTGDAEGQKTELTLRRKGVLLP